MILLGEHEEDVVIENRTRTSDHQGNEAASSDEEGEGQRSGFCAETSLLFTPSQLKPVNDKKIN